MLVYVQIKFWLANPPDTSYLAAVTTVTSLARVRQNTDAPPSPEAFYLDLTAERLIKVVKIENIAVEVCVHVLLVEMLLAVQRKLFVADGTYPPVRLDVPFETALLEVRWKDDLA